MNSVHDSMVGMLVAAILLALLVLVALALWSGQRQSDVVLLTLSRPRFTWSFDPSGAVVWVALVLAISAFFHATAPDRLLLPVLERLLGFFLGAQIIFAALLLAPGRWRMLETGPSSPLWPLSWKNIASYRWEDGKAPGSDVVLAVDLSRRFFLGPRLTLTWSVPEQERPDLDHILRSHLGAALPGGH